jgi:hypothetical protein
MSSPVEQFLSEFITPAKGKGNLAERVKHWVEIANNAQEFYPNADVYELRCHRRNARQNVRRTLAKHPDLIPIVAKLMEAGAAE